MVKKNNKGLMRYAYKLGRLYIIVDRQFGQRYILPVDVDITSVNQ